MIIAAFDFDGTITKRDSIIHLIRWKFGTLKFLVALIRFAPSLVLYKLGLEDNATSKSRIFSFFFKGMSLDEFNRLCLDFANRELPAIVREPALRKLRWHKDQGHTVVVVSASFSNWLSPWSEQHGVDRLFSSELEITDGKLTGKIKSNCYGLEKVNQIKNAYPEREDYHLIAYGDSEGDRALFEYANEYFFKPFD